MADTKITVDLELQDDLTPKLNEVKKGIDSLGKGVEQASFASKQFGELAAGIGYQVGLWNIGFMAASAAMEQAGKVAGIFFQNVTGIQDYIHAQNRMALSGKDAEQAFGGLKMAATAAGISIADAGKSFFTLREAGISVPEATEDVKNFGQRFKETGVDVTDTVAKLKLFKASTEDIVKLATSGKPFGDLYKPATEALKVEAWQPYKELRLSVEHAIQEETFQDRTRMLEREMEATTRTINYEMQDRHRAIEYEMTDRHRLAAQAEQDAQRAYSLRTGGLGAIPGAMDVLAGRATKTPMGYAAAEALRPEYEKGLTEMAKDTGLAVGQLREAVQEGMSPSVVLQYAQAARETEKIANERGREAESIKTGRGLQQESIDTERNLTAWRLENVYKIQDAQIEMERTYSHRRIEDEIDIVKTRLGLEIKANQLIEQDRRERAQKEAKSFGTGQETGAGYGESFGTLGASQQTAEEKQQTDELRNYQDELQKTADKLTTKITAPSVAAGRGGAPSKPGDPGTFEFWTHQTPTSGAIPGSFEFWTNKGPAPAQRQQGQQGQQGGLATEATLAKVGALLERVLGG